MSFVLCLNVIWNINVLLSRKRAIKLITIDKKLQGWCRYHFVPNKRYWTGVIKEIRVASCNLLKTACAKV